MYVRRFVLPLAFLGFLAYTVSTMPAPEYSLLVGPSVIVALFILYTLYLIIRIGSHAIVLNDAWISESPDGRPGKTIGLTQLSLIERTRDGALLVFGPRWMSPLRIHYDLENIDVLRDRLSTHCTIRDRPELSTVQQHPLIFMILWMMISIACTTVRMPALMLGLEASMIAVMVWWLFANRRLFGVEVGRGYQLAGASLAILIVFATLSRLLRGG